MDKNNLRKRMMLHFDGDRLTATEGGRYSGSWPAVSGRPGHDFPTEQHNQGNGPIPEGRYSVGELQHRGIMDDVIGLLGYPFGKEANGRAVAWRGATQGRGSLPRQILIRSTRTEADFRSMEVGIRGLRDVSTSRTRWIGLPTSTTKPGSPRSSSSPIPIRPPRSAAIAGHRTHLCPETDVFPRGFLFGTRFRDTSDKYPGVENIFLHSLACVHGMF